MNPRHSHRPSGHSVADANSSNCQAADREVNDPRRLRAPLGAKSTVHTPFGSNPPRVLAMNHSAGVTSLAPHGANLPPARAGSRARLGRRFLRIAFLCGAIQLTTTVVAVQAVRGSSVGNLGSPCKSHQLVISLGTLSAASGHLALPIRFHDIGGACSLRGFPRVDGLSVSGRVIIRAKRALEGYFGQWRVATVALKHGETASALLEGLDPAFLSRPPRSSERFRITPPNASNGVRRRTSYPLCRLIIHPVVAGRNGGGR